MYIILESQMTMTVQNIPNQLLITEYELQNNYNIKFAKYFNSKICSFIKYI